METTLPMTMATAWQCQWFNNC